MNHIFHRIGECARCVLIVILEIDFAPIKGSFGTRFWHTELNIW